MTSRASAPTIAVHLGAIHPAPTAEEAAAITAAIEMMWPRPAEVNTASTINTSWRFSGRWWAAPLAVSRARPQR